MKIHKRYWAEGDLTTQRLLRNIKCAEILVPEVVSPDFIDSACVINDKSKEELMDLGFMKKIVVKKSVFFK